MGRKGLEGRASEAVPLLHLKRNALEYFSRETSYMSDMKKQSVALHRGAGRDPFLLSWEALQQAPYR